MCSERIYYRCQIKREVPGQADRFAVVVTAPGEFNTGDARMTEQTVSLGELCNSDKNARIKFTLADRNN